MPDQRITLPIEGMTCAACAITVEKQLAETAGVSDAAVNYATGKATVTMGSDTEVAALVQRVRDVGYDCGTATVELAVEGLHYATGVAPLEEEIMSLPGVTEASANQADETLRVTYVPGMVTGRDIELAVERAGLRVAEPIPADDPVEREQRRRAKELKTLGWKFAVAAFSALGTMMLAQPLMAERMAGLRLDLLMKPVDLLTRLLLPGAYGWSANTLRWSAMLLTLPVVAWSGRQFYRGAWSGFKHRTADMNTLIALGTGAAFVHSALVTIFPAVFERFGIGAEVYFEAVGSIVALILLGRIFEARAKGKTSEAIRSLVALRPKTATVLRDGRQVEIEVDALTVGDRVIIRPGESFPADGIVEEGATSVNEAMLTGE
ncbi:MAG: cation transporter, partial [Gemmatimonadales bacterium]